MDLWRVYSSSMVGRLDGQVVEHHEGRAVECYSGKTLVCLAGTEDEAVHGAVAMIPEGQEIDMTFFVEEA